jgi:hypothetical protein
MIKFFRKIRGKMLIENKFGKYLVYAVGEIVLVIIGILIALSINNWSENEKLKDTQQNLLKDLKVEMSSNLKILDEVINRHEKSLGAAQSIDSLFEDRERFNRMSEASFNKLYVEMNSNATYQPNNGILNSIISSGQIKDITNKDLKYLLASVKEKTADAMELTTVIEGWRPELVGKIYKQSFDIVDGKIIGFNTKNLYDSADFRLYNSFLFGKLRIEGLGEEKELKIIMENILDLIAVEIEK